MNVNFLELLRSAHRNFRYCHPDRRDCKRERQVGIDDHIVVELVVRPGTEVVGTDSAAIDGNCDTHLVLLVALPAQENKTVARRVQDRLLQSVGNSIQRRRLIETAVRSSQHPLQARNLNRYTASRAGCGFRHQSCETCESYAAVDAQPLRYFELVFDENRFQVAVHDLPRRPKVHRDWWQCWIRGWLVPDEPQQSIVVLGKTIESQLGVVPALDHGQRSLPAQV